MSTRTTRRHHGRFAPLDVLRTAIVADDDDSTAQSPLTDEAAPEEPFAEPRRRSRFKVAVAASVVAALGLVTGGAVMLTSASTSSATNVHSLAIDKNHPDITKGEPETESSRSTTTKRSSADNSAAAADKGSLPALDGRGSNVSRSTIRSELDKAMSQSMADQRNNAMDATDSQARAKADAVSGTARAKEMDADVAKAKARAKEIAAEKKAAEAKLAAEAAAAGTPIKTGDLSAVTASGAASLPLATGSYTLGSHWGEYGSWARWHTGEDFIASCGTPLHAVSAGIIGQPTGGSWAGNHVVIHMANGASVLYAHMSSINVSVGQTVKAGQLLGYSGETGRAFGCHMHFEYYPAGTTPGDVYSTTDPLVFLRSIGLKP
ncbi:M23 family metallopeptidase [Acidipropionibacterium virtanenii]|uniref:Glycyl-glycine endopeptidase ALE-1 n=1 Tax=Acidipropionibacterium virtanenii TaxID=2057246 RepID=A0A344USH0_9ACTN|nr:peptidoglycan DD-metalloendopeptidase family protein [Acidipropionibacterium virtanenii]AXE38218.1 Glycyl-glycine endopeptidase ALE-1 [Acidipropionibacterium virtanenii]